MDNMPVEDLIKAIKDLTRNKKIVTFRQQPFYGRVTGHFQEGAMNHLTIETTVK